ncbi:hypothetical protein SAMN04487851_106156 [Prevotella sp. tc2-28]|nr:hypothetical protein SAMN04487851_106156 [Prevotella sp. tc2-28]
MILLIFCVKLQKNMVICVIFTNFVTKLRNNGLFITDSETY